MTTKKITVSDAMKCHPLARAVLRQLGGGADAVQSARDAAEHGADGGFGGFTYSNDCRDFVRRNKAAIKEAVQEMARDLGEDEIQMIRGFNCLSTRGRTEIHYDCMTSEVASVLYGDGSDAGDMAAKIYDALAWFALEEVGRSITDLECQ
jgi:hypothetical protein